MFKFYIKSHFLLCAILRKSVSTGKHLKDTHTNLPQNFPRWKILTFKMTVTITDLNSIKKMQRFFKNAFECNASIKKLPLENSRFCINIAAYYHSLFFDAFYSPSSQWNGDILDGSPVKFWYLSFFQLEILYDNSYIFYEVIIFLSKKTYLYLGILIIMFCLSNLFRIALCLFNNCA